MALPPALGTRAQVNDYYQSFRFLVWDDNGGNGAYIQSGAAPTAGFSHCTVPERNLDHIEYSEGTWTYSKIYPGRTTFTSVTLSRGVIQADTAFYDWAIRASEGKDYRTNVTIVNLHRADAQTVANGEFNLASLTHSRKIICYNCTPIRFRPGNDFDSMGSDISIQEIEFQPEYVLVSIATPGTNAP